MVWAWTLPDGNEERLIYYSSLRRYEEEVPYLLVAKSTRISKTCPEEPQEPTC